MITRKLSEHETYKFEAVSAVCFESEYDYEKGQAEAAKQKASDIVRYGSFLDDNETLIGGLQVNPFLVHFDGGQYPLSGIGGVGTLPPYRKMGAINECFKEMLNEGEYMFSYLYPFSFDFYRKVGYDIGCEQVTWTVDFSAYDYFKVEGKSELLFPKSSIKGIRQVYALENEHNNLSVVREKTAFTDIKELDCMKSKRYCYTWKNSSDVTKGFMIFNKKHEDGKTIMDCTADFCCRNYLSFADIEGLKGLLNLAKTLSSNYDAIRFTVPLHIELSSLWKEQNNISRTLHTHGMVRAVDVLAILKAALYKGGGTCRIGISDPQIPKNSGTFHIVFENGRAIAVSKDDNTDADVSMDISSFSSLIVGVYSGVEAVLKPDVVVHGNIETLNRVFYRKNINIIDLF